MKKRFSEELIVGILREVASAGRPVPESCRAAGISVPTYYALAVEVRFASGIRRASAELERQNARPKRILAEWVMEMDATLKLVAKSPGHR